MTSDQCRPHLFVSPRVQVPLSFGLLRPTVVLPASLRHASPSELRWIFAHELTHVSQRKLAEGGRGGAAQWILEGHADWVKVQVLDLLGFRPYRESRDEIVRWLAKFHPGMDQRVLAGTSK